MSLVICKKFNNKLYVESDSRITDINSARKESLYGVIKTVILHPKISISYAGNIYIAERAILEIFAFKKLTIGYLLETLLRYNKDNNNSVEFILAIISHNAASEIIRIKNFSVERNLEAAWIGDIDGFNLFQKQFHNKRQSGKNELDAFREAFAFVVDNPEVQTVGDFQISTHTIASTTGHSRFLYAEKFGILSNESQTFKLTKENNKFIIPWGTAEGGSFGVSYSVSVMPNHYAVGLYFTHGNFGVLFCPRLGFEGIIFSKTSNMNFLHAVNTQYKIPLRGFVMRDNTAMQLVDMRFPDKFKD